MSDALQQITVERSKTANGGWEWYLSICGQHIGDSIYTDSADPDATWPTITARLIAQVAKEAKHA